MWIAVLLAGGGGSRLGGRHKPGITVAGQTLLDRALAAVHGAALIVVVGPAQPTSRPVRWTREDPPGGGPVAALAAGLAGNTEGSMENVNEVVVLATDLAGVTAGTVDRLRATLAEQPDTDGVVLCDRTGRRQWLIGAWRPGPLAAALPADPHGASLHRTLAGLAVAELPELPGESVDIDTPADLAHVLARHEEGPRAGGPSQPSHW
ncbi:MAG TPA: NTP transferase domain-containing protein [Pseudonocardiaceae bacterium]|nr:NTP transferase domain-containing protein [Pseudonocardiaceae bacterium]